MINKNFFENDFAKELQTQQDISNIKNKFNSYYFKNQIKSMKYFQINSNEDKFCKEKLPLFKFEKKEEVHREEIPLPSVPPLMEVFPEPAEPEAQEEELEEDQESEEEKKQPKEENREQHFNQSLPLPLCCESDAKKYQKFLLSAANNFNRIKSKLKEIAFNPTHHKITNKILETLTPLFSQLQSEEVLESISSQIIKGVSDVRKTNNKEIYIYTMDQIINLSFKIANSFIEENNRRKFMLLAKLINKINSSTLTNLFFQKIAYVCPYIIPYEYTQKDFTEKTELNKRNGFFDPNESLINFNKKMDSYEYLYFAFLYCNIKLYLPVIIEFLDSLDDMGMNMSIGNSYKNYLNVFGNYLSDNNYFDKMMKIYDKGTKELQKEKQNARSSDVKSILEPVMHYMKEYMKKIKKKEKTDFFN